MGSKTWIIPVTWSMCGTVTVSAGSWGLSFSEIDLIRELYNDNQEDASSEKGFEYGQGTESQSNHT